MKFSFIRSCFIVFSIFYCFSVHRLVFIFAEDVPEYITPSENISTSITNEDTTIDSDNKDKINNELKHVEPSVVVQSSFDELQNVKSIEEISLTNSEISSQTSEVLNSFTEIVEEVRNSQIDTTIDELNLKTDIPPSEVPSQNEEIKRNFSVNEQEEKLLDDVTSVLKEINNKTDDTVNIKQTDNVEEGDGDVPKRIIPKSNKTDETETVDVKPEDIPSFSEWAQKQLEEAERERANNSAAPNGKFNSNLKVRSKNYASPDCGAKIVAANPEAVSPSAVLSQSRDEYLLNTCTSRIWFIVELCEAVQAKKIDLANFELFSSSPKDISVYLSDRFPSREWSNIGNFAAKDERDVQSFDLNPHLFGKYIKIEMHSHHGSEHFCPISLFRVYGTSEFEVLEKEDQVHNTDDDDDDETLEDNGTAPKNLFSSATDAVISIVKKAAEVLGNKGNVSNQTTEIDSVNSIKYSPLISTCTTPKHLVICDNCNDTLFGKIYELLSCRSNCIFKLLYVPFIKGALLNTYVCYDYGIDFRSTTYSIMHGLYLKSLLPNYYIGALCNGMAILENKAVLNVSKQFPNMTEDVTSNFSNTITNIEVTELHIKPALTKTIDEWSSINDANLEPLELTTTTTTLVINTNDSYESIIKPTKTIQEEDMVNNTNNLSTENISETETVKPTETVNFSSEVMNDNSNDIEISTETLPEFDTATESVETVDENLDKLLSDALNGDIPNNPPSTSTPPSVTPQAQKESVFLRLSNRIKTLERNMSLSSQYLEELSRRYKKQVEEMQRLLENTINSLKEESKRKDEENRRLQQQLIMLTNAVDSLIAEKSSWVNTTYWLFLIGIAFVGILTFCRRNPEFKRNIDDSEKCIEVQRRNSIDVVTHNDPPKKIRRPSEEALRITGSYQHLMVDEIDGVTRKERRDRKRRKKKIPLHRCNSITTLSEEISDNKDQTKIDVQQYFKPIKMWNRQESAPSKLSADWIDVNVYNRGFDDIPFVLEEGEHTALEPLPYQDDVITEEKINGNIIPSLPYIKTAINSRSSRTNIQNISNGNRNKYETHKKSASVDETKRKSSPISQEASEISSISSSFDEKTTVKKEKKSGFKRIFKKVF